MQIAYDPDAFIIEEFYKYPTTVVYRIAEYDEGFHKNNPNMQDDDIKELFNDLLEKVEQQLGPVRDNKIAMKVLHKPTNTTLYVGYKDWNWCIGLGLGIYPGECVKLTALAG